MAVLKIHASKMPLDKVDLKAIAKQADGYSGADLEALCREAGMIALRENVNADKVTQEHFRRAAQFSRPTLVQKPKADRGYS